MQRGKKGAENERVEGEGGGKRKKETLPRNKFLVTAMMRNYRVRVSAPFYRVYVHVSILYIRGE